MTDGRRNAQAMRDIARREAEVLGHEPRIAPMRLDALTPEMLAVLQQMVDLGEKLGSREQELFTPLLVPGALDAPTAEMSAAFDNLPDIIRTVLYHPELFERQSEVGILLLTRGALPPRLRELAILRIARLCGAPYEWSEHVIVARKVGLTGEDFERITQGPDAPGWEPLEQAVLRATDELHADAMISDATWAVLAGHFDEGQLIELPVLVGQYQSVAYYQNALRIRLHNGNDGLRAR